MIRTTLTFRMPTLRWVGTLHPPFNGDSVMIAIRNSSSPIRRPMLVWAGWCYCCYGRLGWPGKKPGR